jgi:hypothetical protein
MHDMKTHTPSTQSIQSMQMTEKHCTQKLIISLFDADHI